MLSKNDAGSVLCLPLVRILIQISVPVMTTGITYVETWNNPSNMLKNVSRP